MWNPPDWIAGTPRERSPVEGALGVTKLCGCIRQGAGGKGGGSFISSLSAFVSGNYTTTSTANDQYSCIPSQCG